MPGPDHIGVFDLGILGDHLAQIQLEQVCDPVEGIVRLDQIFQIAALWRTAGFTYRNLHDHARADRDRLQDRIGIQHLIFRYLEPRRDRIDGLPCFPWRNNIFHSYQLL